MSKDHYICQVFSCMDIRCIEMTPFEYGATRLQSTYVLLAGSQNCLFKVCNSQTTLTSFWLFFTTYPPFVDIFYLINVDKKSTFLDYLPPSSCKHSLWTTPYVHIRITLAVISFGPGGLFISKMPMFQRAGMREGKLPLPPAFQYLILMI